ncbi:MAG: hypothetical protein WCP22_11915 [Chlamydiota bacterium]
MKRGKLLGFGIWDLGFILCVSFTLSACSPPSKPAPPPGGKVTISYWDARGGDAAEPLYDTKFTVSVDGAPSGESPVADRYAHKTLTLRTAPGPHLVVIEGMARKNGAWEKRTAAGGYLFDHRLEKKIDLRDGEKTAINFLVPDRRDNLVIKLGHVPTPPAQPGAEQESASR